MGCGRTCPCIQDYGNTNFMKECGISNSIANAFALCSINLLLETYIEKYIGMRLFIAIFFVIENTANLKCPNIEYLVNKLYIDNGVLRSYKKKGLKISIN